MKKKKKQTISKNCKKKPSTETYIYFPKKKKVSKVKKTPVLQSLAS